MDFDVIGTEALELVKGILTEPRNLALLIPSWVGLEFIASPFARLWVERAADPVTKTWRGALARQIKRTLAVLLCIGLAWIPLAQPDLCLGEDTDACQTIPERLTVACVLGVGLVILHAKVLRRLTAGKSKATKGSEVTLS